MQAKRIRASHAYFLSSTSTTNSSVFLFFFILFLFLSLLHFRALLYVAYLFVLPRCYVLAVQYPVFSSSCDFARQYILFITPKSLLSSACNCVISTLPPALQAISPLNSFLKVYQTAVVSTRYAYASFSYPRSHPLPQEASTRLSLSGVL